jgi:hypothetical protein
MHTRQNEELKSALLNRDFTLAQTLIRAWGKTVANQLRAATGETERRCIFEAAIESGNRNMVLAQVVRAHIASELQSNTASFRYLQPDLEPPHWRLNG